MKPTKLFAILNLVLFFQGAALAQTPPPLIPANQTTPSPNHMIILQTKNFSMNFQVGEDGRLYQLPLGTAEAKAKNARREEAYPQAGDGYVWEPAIEVVHADGNTSTALQYTGITRTPEGEGRELVRLALRDTAYAFHVTLCFRLHAALDVIEQWVEIRHEEPKPVVLQQIASAALMLPENSHLTHFYGDWAKEMSRMTTEKLTPGLKVLDSKIGVRAHQFRNPNFILSLDGPPTEDSGRVLAGSLAWSGNFRFAFDGDGSGVRALCGVNPFASAYTLSPRKTFVTPTMIWAWSSQGLGPMSRHLHAWARDFGVRDGHTPRAVLLNNWEATGFNFDQQRITGLFPSAQAIGTELFLLDDGWFGDRHARTNDRAGLGDWMPNPSRFPKGMAPLATEASKHGMRFGIWIEPEMVNPSSELYEKHPDWVIRQPMRKLDLQRNQLVLDLTRPAVQEFAWNTIHDILSVPGISYAKWDCNRYLTQPGSPYLAADRQSHLWIDYVHALYDLMAKTAKTFPDTELMLCAGGGGRVDYGALKYFHDFWPSDNTDPVARVPMQWDYSYFFPSIATASHVTHMGKRPIHFSCVVAMSARFGMDLDLAKMSPEEIAICTQAIRDYKKIREVVQMGDLYRLERPHGAERGALNYVSPDRARAVVFVFQLKDGEARPVRPQGLDLSRKYAINELIPVPGRAPMSRQRESFTGAELMRDGVVPSCTKANEACVVELGPVRSPAK